MRQNYVQRFWSGAHAQRVSKIYHRSIIVQQSKILTIFILYCKRIYVYVSLKLSAFENIGLINSIIATIDLQKSVICFGRKFSSQSVFKKKK